MRSLGLEHPYKLLVVVCRVEEHQHQLAHQCSVWEDYSHKSYIFTIWPFLFYTVFVTPCRKCTTILFRSNSTFPIIVVAIYCKSENICVTNVHVTNVHVTNVHVKKILSKWTGNKKKLPDLMQKFLTRARGNVILGTQDFKPHERIQKSLLSPRLYTMT